MSAATGTCSIGNSLEQYLPIGDMVRLLENERGRLPGGLLCGPPAADHDRFGSSTDLAAPKFDFRSYPESGLNSDIAT